MSFLSFFKKPSKKQESSNFDFPSDTDLEMPPPPPSLEDSGDLTDSMPETDSEHFSLKEEEPQIDEPHEEEHPVQVGHDKQPEEEPQADEPHEEEHPAPVEHIGTKPIFVLLEHFKELISKVNDTKALLKSSESSLAMINDLRLDSDDEFERWHKQANEVLKKLTLVDKILFER